MRRRQYIALLGAVAVAGCGGAGTDDDDYEDGGGTGNGNDDEDALELIEHELVVEDDDFLEEVSIEGVVANNSDEQVDYVEVRARIYDEDDRQLDQYFTNTSDLGAGREWAFEIMVLEDAEDVADYDIAVSDSPF